MNDTRTELGYLKSHPGPRARTDKHSWRETWREFRLQKHVCRHCRLERIKTVPVTGFPTARYKTAAGIESSGKAPACAP